MLVHEQSGRHQELSIYETNQYPVKEDPILMQEIIIERLHSLGISELIEITSLNELSGEYINLECRLPNGSTGKILDNSKKYFANQVEKKDSDRCYGIAADNQQLAVYEYGCNGTEAVLIAWVSL